MLRIEDNAHLGSLDDHHGPMLWVDPVQMRLGDAAVHGWIVKNGDAGLQRFQLLGLDPPIRQRLSRSLCHREQGCLKRHAGPERDLAHVQTVLRLRPANAEHHAVDVAVRRSGEIETWRCARQ